MTKSIIPVLSLLLIANVTFAQKLKSTAVPDVVKTALSKKFPNAAGIAWEKEKGNYEAAWGGSSKEDYEVLFTPEGALVETVVAIPVSELPPTIITYVKKNYPGAKIKEAGKITSADGKLSYETEVNRKDIVFDAAGNFVKTEAD